MKCYGREKKRKIHYKKRGISVSRGVSVTCQTPVYQTEGSPNHFPYAVKQNPQGHVRREKSFLGLCFAWFCFIYKGMKFVFKMWSWERWFG